MSSFFCSNIQEMRKVHKDVFLKKHNVKLGFMSAFVKAAAYALTDQPAVNAGRLSDYLQCCVLLEKVLSSTTKELSHPTLFPNVFQLLMMQPKKLSTGTM